MIYLSPTGERHAVHKMCVFFVCFFSLRASSSSAIFRGRCQKLAGETGSCFPKRTSEPSLSHQALMTIQRSHQLFALTSLPVVPYRPRHPLRLFMPPLLPDRLQDGRFPNRCTHGKIQSGLFTLGIHFASTCQDGMVTLYNNDLDH